MTKFWKRMGRGANKVFEGFLAVLVIALIVFGCMSFIYALVYSWWTAIPAVVTFLLLAAWVCGEEDTSSGDRW